MKVIILGGGPAGCSAAYFLKKRGISDITIVEKENYLGGCVRTNFYDGIPYEFGPQVMYTDEERLRKVFEEFLTQYSPPTIDKKFHPALSIDGTLNEGSVHDFPITIENVLKLPNPEEVIFELYNIDLENPDFSNFENYVISRVGRTLYENFVKNYNIKQWKIHPREMDTEWAKFRNLTLKPKNLGMFGDKWQGHPGDYNPMWDGMGEGVKRIQGTASISEDATQVMVNGEKIEADLFISTIPLSQDLEFINTCKVFISLKGAESGMTSYATSFPNSYNFVRVMDYKQQYFVESESSLIDFAFPWKDSVDENLCKEEALGVVKKILKKEVKEVWVDNREYMYPVSTKRNLEIVERQFERYSHSNILPMGRLGIHAYVSKDTCIRMGYIMDEHFDILIDGTPEQKQSVFYKMREKLT